MGIAFFFNLNPIQLEPGRVWWLFGRRLWPLREQHSGPQQIHKHPCGMPGWQNEAEIWYLRILTEILKYWNIQLAGSMQPKLTVPFLHPLQHPVLLACWVRRLRTVREYSVQKLMLYWATSTSCSFWNQFQLRRLRKWSYQPSFWILSMAAKWVLEWCKFMIVNESIKITYSYFTPTCIVLVQDLALFMDIPTSHP